MPKKEWIGNFLPKNENISGKILHFVYQQTCGFGNVFSKKSELAFLFCQKTEIFLEINDPIVLVIFFAKKLDWHFLVKNEKIVGKTLDFMYQRPRCFGNLFAKKDWIGIFFFAKKRKLL